jgi:L-alanine-DL-glutamate epimerase-like enolase superfamily enzyme
MRIRSVETYSVGLPFKDLYVTSTGSLDRREMAILRLISDDGIRGHGDAVPLSLRGGPGLDAVLADLDGPCREVLSGASAETTAEAGELVDGCRAAGAGPQAVAAVDAALLDLVGRSREMPAWRLLGAAEARTIACNGTLGAVDPEEAAVAAAELAAAGFAAIKVKVGAGADRERMQAVRDACGPDVALRVDANGAWSLPEAEAELRWLEELELELAEQPCARIEDDAALRELVDVPIVLDESVATEADALLASELGACDAATLKLAKVGGARAALAIAEGLPSYLSSALDSPLGIAAAVHTAQALPGRGFAAGLAHGLATTSLFSDNIADPEPFSGPTIGVPAGPGLGVEIDDDALDRLALR